VSPEARHIGIADDVFEARRPVLTRIWETLRETTQVVLTTHVNADGDGAGSEVAMAHLLRRHGVMSSIINPSTFPAAYRFLLGDVPALDHRSHAGRRALDTADVLIVLDAAEPRRLGALATRLTLTPIVVIDHHPPVGEPLGDPDLRDPHACATGELVFDLCAAVGTGVTQVEAQALYIAIVTDTGSFRFSNTTPRAHLIAARLLEAGVTPDDLYGPLFGQLTPRRLAVLQVALGNLERDPEWPLAWVSLRQDEVERTGARSEDMDGIVEYPRRMQGVEVAILFRELGPQRTKVSLRSSGTRDVADVARQLGGGGHPKAAGAVLDLSLEQTQRQVLEAVRARMGAEDAGRREGNDAP
jgi:phosphoesterase RecJ-like protein